MAPGPYGAVALAGGNVCIRLGGGARHALAGAVLSYRLALRVLIWA